MATKDLSISELHAWSYIQENPEKVTKMSIVQLSQETNVSTATIVRALQKMGYHGFSSFRDHLLQQGANQYSVLNNADDAVRSVISKNEIEMKNTLSNLDLSIIDKSISITQTASIIYIFARGLSESIAKEIMVKLQLTGKYVEFFSDPNIIRTIAKTISSSATVIFISLNGETQELVDAAKQLKKNQISTITFTTNSSGSLLRYTELNYIGYKSKTNYFPDYEVRSRLPLQIMARIFCDAYSVRSGFVKNTTI